MLKNVFNIYQYAQDGYNIYVSKVKSANIVEGDPKAPISIATTSR